MTFVIEVEFPGGEWSNLKQEIELHDDSEDSRGMAKRTADHKVVSMVRALERQYRKYGAKVTYRALGVSA